MDAKLVIVDPIMAFLGENINSNSDKDVRSALKPLKQLAERSGAAVLIVRHLNKTPGGNVLYRGGGSIGIIGAARSGLVVGPHPHGEELRVLASQKHNLSMPPESLSYQITSAPNNPDAAAIVYKGVTEMNARDILKAPVEEERSALEEAKDFLLEALETGKKRASLGKARPGLGRRSWTRSAPRSRRSPLRTRAATSSTVCTVRRFNHYGERCKPKIVLVTMKPLPKNNHSRQLMR